MRARVTQNFESEEQPLGEDMRPRRDGFSRRTIGIAVLIVILVALGVWIGTMMNMQSDEAELSPYSAVYMSTGDVYFGEFSRFPKPHIKNVYLLQRAVDQGNNPQLQIVPLKSVFWAPGDTLYLNGKNIVFWARLRADSQVAKIIEDPSLLQGGGQQLPPGFESELPTSTNP